MAGKKDLNKTGVYIVYFNIGSFFYFYIKAFCHRETTREENLVVDQQDCVE